MSGRRSLTTMRRARSWTDTRWRMRTCPTSSLIGAALFAVVFATTARGQAPPAAPRRIAEVPLRAIPVTVSYRGRPVQVRYPEEPEVRALGGSGGPIINIAITPPDDSGPLVFRTQATGLAVVESQSDWPAFEIWSSAGGGIFTRAIYTWRPDARRYCADRVDEFEDEGDEPTTPDAVALIGVLRFVRYSLSRPYGCPPS